MDKLSIVKKVVLALEDLDPQKGIGYRSAGNKLYTHIDVRNRKWYGDEAISQTKPCCDSFYEYFGIKKESDVFVEGDYITLEELYVRKGPGTNYGIKKTKELTNDGRNNATKKEDFAKAEYKKGTIFTAKEIIKNDYGVWAKTPSGYICLKGQSGKIYCIRK